jgi:hypothetical protein
MGELRAGSLLHTGATPLGHQALSRVILLISSGRHATALLLLFQRASQTIEPSTDIQSAKKSSGWDGHAEESDALRCGDAWPYRLGRLHERGDQASVADHHDDHIGAHHDHNAWRDSATYRAAGYSIDR